MNRREFFSFCAVAPVAVPMAVASGIPTQLIVDKLAPYAPISTDAFLHLNEYRDYLVRMLRSGVLSLNEVRELESRHPIAARNASKVFVRKFNCQGDHEVTQQSLASPEDPNLIS